MLLFYAYKTEAGYGEWVKNINYPHHHARFDFDESVLWLGAALLAETSWQYTQGNATK